MCSDRKPDQEPSFLATLRPQQTRDPQFYFGDCPKPSACGSANNERAFDPFLSGQWRTNKMIDGNTHISVKNSLALQRANSFEDACMEDYGKVLLNSLHELIEGESGNEVELGHKRVDESGLEEELLTWIECNDLLGMPEKTVLKLLFESNYDAKRLMIFLFDAESARDTSFQLLALFFHSFKTNNIEMMEEQQIVNFVSENVSSFSQEVSRLLFPSTGALSTSGVQQMVGVWAESIFLGLSGIFQKSQPAAWSLEQIVTEEECYPRKMMKLF